ncbi:MAG: hypothetical protein V4594_20050 [Bacteroidota bacterium]
MTRNEFVTLHIETIKGLKSADAKKKDLASSLFKYLLTFKSREVTFHVDQFSQHSGLEASFLNQPHDTHKNPSYAAPLMDMFGLGELLMDENKYQSLVESSLILLMTADLQLYSMRYFCYNILSSTNKLVKHDAFFASEFTIKFSDHFWSELSLCS